MTTVFALPVQADVIVSGDELPVGTYHVQAVVGGYSVQRTTNLARWFPIAATQPRTWMVWPNFEAAAQWVDDQGESLCEHPFWGRANNSIPTQLNIAPKGKSWLGGKLVDGMHGYPTRETMEKAERPKDRLERFRNHIQRKLETDIERVGELASWCKLWPQRASEVRLEQEELDCSIPELRAVIAYLRDFENEERQANDDNN